MSVLRDINLLPAAHKPKPLVNIWQLTGIGIIVAFLLAASYYVFSTYMQVIPNLDKNIKSLQTQINTHQRELETYRILNDYKEVVGRKKNLINSMNAKKDRVADIFQNLNGLKPSGDGFVLTGSKLQENGAITITGKAANIKQVNDYIGNLNDSFKGKYFDNIVLVNIKNENGKLTFEVSGKIKKGSVVK